ncbi:glutathione S-transferase family protein [Rhizobiales bacterium]|uniref:glutathione S-transferase family protein n=1 Tax=Hongsoonwoonella zoysiae TaxID=2821844 RepID=UPI0015605DF4|nr:glutathione S-transferase family protein [Hongsoonwoonella zoysiae]NRG19196.1 glutathione S-transferase family protein [Hongsoonwoonella zoysiae]
MRLAIGNKNYSSWSLRAWLAMKLTGADFDEILILLDTPEFKAEVERFSPAGRVPTLIDGDVVVWDSLSIIEYLAEKFPEKGIWPKDQTARANARSIVAEMHSGFQDLRNGYPMNLRRKPASRAEPFDAKKDIERVRDIWRDCREKYSSDGMFLFGDFSAVDCFYAPVVTRFLTYQLPLAGVEKAYAHAVMEHSFMRQWREEALKEPWIVAADEAE